ncbi:hypothetical protein WR25_08099 [Diploscapter pachys]|uniref:Uncharacterized protein n=1 Tax=Diploscapter pachys TaxID=2018661 RepID=A0A2A2LMS6_9BILA|nr:hypothetical protein WR25_08099 [Diploscapter pachys]
MAEIRHAFTRLEREAALPRSVRQEAVLKERRDNLLLRKERDCRGELRNYSCKNKIEQLKEQMEEIGQGRGQGQGSHKRKESGRGGEKQLEHVARLISNDRGELRCTMQIAERGNQETTQQRLITRL